VRGAVGPVAVSAGVLVVVGVGSVVVVVTGFCGGFFGAVVLVGVLLVGAVVSVTVVVVELCNALVGASPELLGFTGSSSTRPDDSTGSLGPVDVEPASAGALVCVGGAG
jgi:hypothetical protein